MPVPRPRRLLPLALDAALLLALMAYVAGGRTLAPFHGDESTFLWMSRDVERLAGGDADALRFDPAPRDAHAQWLRVLNGSLTPLAIGLSWTLAGRDVGDLNGPWNWEPPGPGPLAQWQFNVRHRRLPDRELLAQARLPSTAMTALGVAAVFALALALSGGRVAAWAAALWLATTPAVLLNGRRALQEGGLLLLAPLVALLAWRIARATGREQGAVAPLGAHLALAAAAGLALATKHSAALVVAAAWLALGVDALARARAARGAARAAPVGAWLGSALAALAVFLLAMPVWWSWPRTLGFAAAAALAFSAGRKGPPARRGVLRGAALAGFALTFAVHPGWIGESAAQVSHLLAERRALLERQTGRFAGEDALAARAAALLTGAFAAGAEHFEDPAWAGFPEIRAQVAAYESSPLAGRPAGWVAGGIGLGLFAVGLASLWRRRDEPGTLLLALWLGLSAWALLASPLSWARYQLVLQPPVAVAVGLGAGVAARWRGPAA